MSSLCRFISSVCSPDPFRFLPSRFATSWLPLAILITVSRLSSSECTAQLCAQLNGTNFSENFNTMATSGTNNTSIPPEFKFDEDGTSSNLTYSAGTGSASGGETYSLGSTGSSDRALGEITSSTVQSTLGACFVNNTNHPITSFLISYTGEQWRSGVQNGAVDRLDFEYTTEQGATLTTGTYIPVNSLDFATPNNGAAAGALDGNANRTVFVPTAITPATVIQPEATFYIHWLPVLISGDNDALAIDDFTLGAAYAPGLAGDYNNNNTVDAADYVVWRNNLNQAVTIPNDITPGTVVNQDYTEWVNRFGIINASASAASSADSAAVPEPVTWLLALFALAVLSSGAVRTSRARAAAPSWWCRLFLHRRDSARADRVAFLRC
jgi:hypothetical protein